MPAPGILRAIPGLEGYFAGNDGTIWSGKHGRYPIPPGKQLRCLRPYLNAHGYWTVNLMRPGAKKGTNYLVNRLIALAFHGLPAEGLVVCHLNHVRTDNRPENLAYATQTENVAQSVAADRQARGAQLPQTKLTEAQVIEIRSSLLDGTAAGSLAEFYGVTVQHINRIRRLCAWKHLRIAE